GMGAELGHMTLVHEGELCSCGVPGCFERYASATALIRQTKAAMAAHPESRMHAHAAERGKVSGRTAFDCARAGDAAALAVVDAYTTYIAGGVGPLCTIFRPEIVLIGGGISHEGDYLIEPIRRKLPRYVHASDIIGCPPVAAAALGNRAGMIGAAFLDSMQ
ncbi:MAG: ROK family protein, partial [Clostridia bacterium]|nr:ROK family protein [Clostridia bacterium]